MNLGNLQIAQSNQPEDMMSHLGGVMQVADMMEQHQMNRQVMKMQLQRQQGIRQILQGSTSPDGQLDHVGAIQKMYQAGYGPEAQEYEQKFGEYQKNIAQAKSDTAHAETFNAEAEQKKVDTAKTYQDLMKRDDDKTSGLLHAAADAAKTDPTAASMYYGQAVTEHKANAQKWGRPADYMPDQFDPEKVGQIADAFDEHSQGHQEHIKNQIDLANSGLKITKDKLEVNQQFGPTGRNKAALLSQTADTMKQMLDMLKSGNATAEDLASAKDRIMQSGAYSTMPTSLQGDANKLFSYFSGKSLEQVSPDQLNHAKKMAISIGRAAVNSAQGMWENDGKKAFPQYTDMFDNYKNTYPKTMFDEYENDKTNTTPSRQSTSAPTQTAAQPARDSLPKVSDQKSYDSIPKGQRYVDPNGKIRTKG